MCSDDDLYQELCCYTLAHGHPSFIHQHVVDAFTAQRATERTKPIALTFALVGLYLHVEKRRTGRQVQLAHMALAKRKQPWPSFALPAERGTITVTKVMAEPPGPTRDAAIHDWCASVWEAYRHHGPAVAELLTRNGVVG
jgi:hypothetical protein